MSDIVHALDQSADWIREQDPRAAGPLFGVVLGSGLGDFTNHLDDVRVFPYADVPAFPETTVVGHDGAVVVGTFEGVTVVALRGRVHLYEGADPTTLVHPVRTLARMGAGGLLVTNAAGSVNRSYQVGDLMLITDHLNLTGRNPLVGPNDDRLGPRFPDVTRAYDPGMSDAMRAEARALGITLREGVYAGMLGPSYETPAEIHMVRTIGGDAVGMSTVLEVLAARHMGLRCVGVSVISNLAAGEGDDLDHSEVKEVADAAGPRLIALVRGLLRRKDDWWQTA